VPYAYMLRLRSVQDDEEGQQPNHSELSHRARAKLLVSVAVVASASKRLVRWRRRRTLLHDTLSIGYSFIQIVTAPTWGR